MLYLKSDMKATILTAECKRQRGFTLIELLVVMAIISVLATLGFAGGNMAMEHARKSREINAGKSLIAAYSTYTEEHGGELMPGNDKRVNSVDLQDGKTVSGPAANRYPFRLAEYLGYKLEGTILVNKNVTQVEQTDEYMVSLYPAMGINFLCVGGDVSSDGKHTMSDTITAAAQASTAPIVFASAASGGTGASNVEGYCFITPPKSPGATWSTSEWTSNSNAASYGHVSGRYSGKAVCAYLDGAVRVQSMTELQDMRFWSSAAAYADDRNYVPKRKSSGGR